jgi:mono/diheme cytochrome c family protein
MKKLFLANKIIKLLGILTIVTNINIASGQSGIKRQFEIPDNINKIFQVSCLQCHGSNGGRLPKSKLNFSRWASYGQFEEAKKASSICTSVSKGEMPPKSKRDSNPELILAKEQIALVCEWAALLRTEKKEK